MPDDQWSDFSDIAAFIGKWKRETPTVAGWYWASDGVDTVDLLHFDGLRTYGFDWWLGPLPVPGLPKVDR